MNKYGRYFSTAFLASWLVFISGCGTYTTVRQHPDFAGQDRKIQKVALLPPDVEYTYLVFTGDNERMPDKEKSIADSLAAVIPAAFKDKGYMCSKFNLDEEADQNPELRYEFEQLKKAYLTASDELYSKGMMEEGAASSMKVSLGTVVNQFADLADADALIVARFSGFKKSDGLLNKDRAANVLLAALTGVYNDPARSGGAVEIALVDGANGDVLWSNVYGGTVGSTMLASKALKDLPAISMEAEPAEGLREGGEATGAEHEEPDVAAVEVVEEKAVVQQ